MRITFFKTISLMIILILTSNCASTQKKSVHGEEPLIDPSKVIVEGTKEMQEKVKYGPKPYETEFDPTANKRKTITTEQVRNYVTISNEYDNLNKPLALISMALILEMQWILAEQEALI